MQNITDIRIRNARAAIDKFGGVTKLAKVMGYSNASFLSQQFGPMAGTDAPGVRNPSEKTIRRMEEAMGLTRGFLDDPYPGEMVVGPVLDELRLTPHQLSQVKEKVVGIVRRTTQATDGKDLSNGKLSTLIILTLLDAIDHNFELDVEKLEQAIALAAS